ncbi:hypothetical protein DPMN_157900 [Dreissena polymorpha]|uniref:Uncharacterized protein n=1 Tax=Dreissena polymorpha TaxID=45954 RepID=A0A9D4ELA1_DREPO|nr:hypothetical protein DPMN_157900 [Dreissena polymorpha]
MSTNPCANMTATRYKAERLRNIFSDNAKERQVQHACEVANMAVDIMTCCSDLEIGKFGRTKLLMKVALHSGKCLFCNVHGSAARAHEPPSGKYGFTFCVSSVFQY